MRWWWLFLLVACVAPEGRRASECVDDADNDRDGLFDCEDPDCAEHCGDTAAR